MGLASAPGLAERAEEASGRRPLKLAWLNVPACWWDACRPIGALQLAMQDRHSATSTGARREDAPTRRVGEWRDLVQRALQRLLALTWSLDIMVMRSGRDSGREREGRVLLGPDSNGRDGCCRCRGRAPE